MCVCVFVLLCWFELNSYKQKKNDDLDLLRGQFEKVVVNKDTAIAQLRMQVHQLSAEMQSLNQL